MHVGLLGGTGWEMQQIRMRQSLLRGFLKSAGVTLRAITQSRPGAHWEHHRQTRTRVVNLSQQTGGANRQWPMANSRSRIGRSLAAHSSPRLLTSGVTAIPMHISSTHIPVAACICVLPSSPINSRCKISTVARMWSLLALPNHASSGATLRPFPADRVPRSGRATVSFGRASPPTMSSSKTAPRRGSRAVDPIPSAG
jgi:hypothetical protein